MGDEELNSLVEKAKAVVNDQAFNAIHLTDEKNELHIWPDQKFPRVWHLTVYRDGKPYTHVSFDLTT